MAFWIVALTVFAADFATKALVRAKMFLHQEIPVLPFFSLTHVHNTGIAFGLFQEKNFFFLIFGLGVAVALAVFGHKLMKEDRISALAIASVLGGAAGNLIDRFRFGRVTDFLDFYAGSYHWPVFNIADSAICVGAGLLLWRQLRPPRAA